MRAPSWPSRKGAQWRFDEGFGPLEPAVEEDGADHGLDHVADDIVADVGAVLARLAAEADVARKVERPADLGAGLARHQRIVAPGHLPFGLAREALVQPVGDDQAEHPVAEELEPLVGVAAVAAMGQRPLEQAWGCVGSPPEQRSPTKGGRSIMDGNRSPSRSVRKRAEPGPGLIQELALPSVDQKASSPGRPDGRPGRSPCRPASVIAAVEAVVAIVAHHEDMAVRELRTGPKWSPRWSSVWSSTR